MKKIKWIIPTLALMLAIGGSGTIAASAEKNLVDGLPFDPADREKQVVYISTLGELLSYTFDFFDGNGTMYLQYKLYNEYTLVLTKDMDLETDTSWHEYAPGRHTAGRQERSAQILKVQGIRFPTCGEGLTRTAMVQGRASAYLISYTTILSAT